MGIKGRAADQPLVEFEAQAKILIERGNDLADFGHRFRADPVAGEEEEFSGCHDATPSLEMMACVLDKRRGHFNYGAGEGIRGIRE
ncbi:hypothetical protein GCM10011491_18930 [Brucella endophytica]|uniref:Uncharacterized protein n=1 Tax=Brucella endophytica TaxID=1963359 RepID=A0A916SAW5_9HYPH|nr:hypothetical protein GCM10011491_18930 [Brucella endophytica]